MAKRALSDWVSAYLEYADETEPPLAYHTWIALSCLGSSLRRRCFLRWGYETIYPNMYVVLVGPSGRCRKGTAMKMGYEIIKNIGLKIASESVIREALIRTMKTGVDSFIDPQTKLIHYHSSITIHSPELSVFLGQNNVKFLADLTDWYDCAEKWTYETKNSGVDTIQGVCLNILGATAADWLVSILPQEAIGGGFTSRIIFVVEENKRKTVPEYIPSARSKILVKALSDDLEKIGTLAGQFVFSPDAKDMYISWYEEQDRNTLKGKMAVSDPRFAGYCERRATHIRKLCMLFTASRGDDMLILPDDFERATNVLAAAEVKMPKVFGGLGAARYSQVTEKVMDMIIKRGKIWRSELLLAFHRDVDMETLELIERTLSAMKVIKVTVDPQMGDSMYTFIGKK